MPSFYDTFVTCLIPYWTIIWIVVLIHGIYETLDNHDTHICPWYIVINRHLMTNFIIWTFSNQQSTCSVELITSPPIGGGRGIVMPMSVCLFVCLFVCVCVCLFVCPCFRKISKCNISAISQPIIMKLGIHVTYGYTVTDKYFQNFRSKVKVVGRRKVKNVIWPYLGNEWS